MINICSYSFCVFLSYLFLELNKILVVAVIVIFELVYRSLFKPSKLPLQHKQCLNDNLQLMLVCLIFIGISNIGISLKELLQTKSPVQV